MNSTWRCCVADVVSIHSRLVLIDPRSPQLMMHLLSCQRRSVRDHRALWSMCSRGLSLLNVDFLSCLSSVHMKIEEKISLTCGRDGGLQNMELHGMIMLHISDEKFARIRLHVENEDKRGVQLQVK